MKIELRWYHTKRKAIDYADGTPYHQYPTVLQYRVFGYLQGIPIWGEWQDVPEEWDPTVYKFDKE